ncbi:hypothetical protein [Polynucleobacter sp. UK-Mo-2m-Kol15]|nr:hypothetical protein [Polynucleobacter sp. UK-Mo-2m-Kol15]
MSIPMEIVVNTNNVSQFLNQGIDTVLIQATPRSDRDAVRSMNKL